MKRRRDEEQIMHYLPLGGVFRILSIFEEYDIRRQRQIMTKQTPHMKPTMYIQRRIATEENLSFSVVCPVLDTVFARARHSECSGKYGTDNWTGLLAYVVWVGYSVFPFNPCHAEQITTPTSKCQPIRLLGLDFDINSYTLKQTVQIQISWLLQLWIYTVCKGRAYPGSAGQGLRNYK